jgi:Pyruvate/2-oxoacid:ferredoxin oxidoreductase delta subunit
MKPVLNKRRCSAQESICPVIPACSQQAVYYVQDEEEPLGGRIEFDYARCDGCGQCVEKCCGQAIEMREVLIS